MLAEMRGTPAKLRNRVGLENFAGPGEHNCKASLIVNDIKSDYTFRARFESEEAA